MTKGKLAAQVAHASMAFLSNHLRDNKILSWFKLSKAEKEWIENSFVKIVVGVDSLEDLLKVKNEADRRGIKAYIIKDEGRTEFKEPTVTCLGIGPDYPELLSSITGHLKLL